MVRFLELRSVRRHIDVRAPPLPWRRRCAPIRCQRPSVRCEACLPSRWCRSSLRPVTSPRPSSSWRRRPARRSLPDPAGHHREREERHHRLDHRAGPEADADPGAQQVAGRSARQRDEGSSPQPGGVLRLLLRLLPTRGIHPLERHLHREGLVGERRDRAAAALGHVGSPLPQGRHRGGLGVGHLRPGLARGVPQQGAQPAGWGGARSALDPAPAGRHAVRAQRHEPRPGPLPGRGDTIEVHPAYEEHAVRVELFGDEVEQIVIVDPLTGERIETIGELTVWPATTWPPRSACSRPSSASRRS